MRILMLGKIALTLAIAVTLACGSCARNPVPDEPRTLNRPTVGKLIIIDSDGNREGLCTAWKATEDLIVTAGHCCEDGHHYMLEGDAGVPGTRIVSLVDNDKVDVCVLHGKMRGEPIKLAHWDPQIGSKVWVAGYPKGYFMIGEGYWSGRDITDDNARAMFSIDAVGGYSGSPVLNTDGRVVAILVEGYLGASVTFGVNLNQIRIAIKKARATAVPSEDDLTGELPTPVE